MVGVVANDDDVKFLRVEAAGEVTDEVHFVGLAQVVYHIVDDTVDAGILAHEALYVGEEGVFFVRLKHLAVAIALCFEQTGLLQPVQLDPQAIGALIELFAQPTEVAGAGGVQKELQQQAYAGFGSDEGV